MSKELFLMFLKKSLPTIADSLEDLVQRIVDSGQESCFYRESVNNILHQFGKKLIRENVYDPRIEEVWFFQRWIWVIQ
jgi:hypothetical protein